MRKSKPLTALRVWLRHRSNRRIIARLSDRALRDLGLSRASVGYAAAAGASRTALR